MPYKILCHHDQGWVESTYYDEVSLEEIQAATTECIELEKNEGLLLFLADTTRMRLSAAINMINLYDIPAQQWIEEEADVTGKLAILPAPTERERNAMEFYETVCQNRGWMVKVFDDRQMALDWLLADTDKTANPDDIRVN